MGRPKGSTWNTDLKIILALLYKPRKFSEFEYALVNQFCPEWEENSKLKKSLIKRWRIPRRSLARRLKHLVAKGWVKREILHKHGHHVVYSLNFSKADEILKTMPKPEISLKDSEEKLIKKAWVDVPLRNKLPKLNKLSTDEIVEIYLRLRKGEYICPNCLRKGREALNVHEAVDGRLYCRNCGQEVSIDECNKLLEEVMSVAFERDMNKALTFLRQFLKAVDEQLKKDKAIN